MYPFFSPLLSFLTPNRLILNNDVCYKIVTFVAMKILRLAKSLFLFLFLGLIFLSVRQVYAATSPDLGDADSFAILSSTYTNTAGGTTINGDLGYTTGPATAPTVNGTTYTDADATYNQAGIDQGSALTDLNNQACTHTFDPGAIDLASNVDFPTSTYTPGVYCITGAASIGGGGTITLNGSGTYIFRMDGALTTSANSIVAVSGGASACDVWWTPTEATTLGADSTFLGTDISAAGITIGSNVTWTGRALAFGGTVSTDADTISTPTCTTAASSGTSTVSSSDSTSGFSVSDPPAVCVSTGVNAQPLIIESHRVSPTSTFLSWGPYEGLNTFVIRYGLEDGNWLYNTTVTGFSTIIGSLPTNQPIWVSIAATDGCAIGSYSLSRLIGSPRLPDSGVGMSSPKNIFSVFIENLRDNLMNSLNTWFSSFLKW